MTRASIADSSGASKRRPPYTMAPWRYATRLCRRHHLVAPPARLTRLPMGETSPRHDEVAILPIECRSSDEPCGAGVIWSDCRNFLIVPPAPDDFAPPFPARAGIGAAARSCEPHPTIEAIKIAAMDCGVLVADGPEKAAVPAQCREDESPPEAQRDATEVGAGSAKPGEFDSVALRQSSHPLADERVGGNDGDPPS